MSSVPTSPPSLPAGSIYTRCYCEENIYLLCNALLSDVKVTSQWRIFAVFISNERKTVALWSQKAASDGDSAVVWDYHVILVLKHMRSASAEQEQLSLLAPALDGVQGNEKPPSWVYDFDTTLPTPCSWEEYYRETFYENIPTKFHSKFRVVPGHLFVQHFASDRTHMLVKNQRDGVGKSEDAKELISPTYIQPPPLYPAICGPLALEAGVAHNLMTHYVDMSERDSENQDNHGTVLDYSAACTFFGAN